MRKTILIRLLSVVCLITPAILHAQSSQPTEAKTKETIATVKTVNDLKTGNWQDVLTSFFQLGFNDLTGKDRAFNFKSSLFGLKLKTNPGLTVDTEYVKHSFDRNLQFDFALRLDESYKFNGFSGGITWAAINKRDTTLISFVGTKMDSLWREAYNKLDEDIITYRNQKLALKTHKDSVEFFNTNAILARMMAVNNIVPDSLPADFPKTTFASINTVYKAYEDAKQSTRQKGLLTLSINGAFSQQSTFDSAQFSMVYLQGITSTGKSLELDARATFSYQDTTIGKDKYRSLANGSLGLNYALISNRKTKMSIVEVKPYFAYKRVIGALFPDEQKELFTANAEIRIRVLHGLWIPFTVKYDLKKSNFLGFLNVSLNMSALKKSST